MLKGVMGLGICHYVQLPSVYITRKDGVVCVDTKGHQLLPVQSHSSLKVAEDYLAAEHLKG